MNLIVYSEKINQCSALVFWKTNADMSGLVEITLEFDTPNIAIAAELVAIKYLLFDERITGSQVLSGSNLTIEVSKGAIKKILNGKSDKKEVIKFASFLNLISDGLTVNTHRWNPSEDEREYLKGRKTNVFAKSKDFTQPSLVIDELPCLGKIIISEHSLRRFEEKMLIEAGECKKPLSSLVKRLSHKDLILVNLPKKVVFHKEKKYGHNDTYEVWKHPTSTINFAFVTNQDDTFKTLVTVFINKQY